jgi:hypothetical protein
VLQTVWGSTLFKARQTANAKHSKVVAISTLSRRIRRASTISCPDRAAGPVLVTEKKIFEYNLLMARQRLTAERPDFR